jgi:hypothetical protein
VLDFEAWRRDRDPEPKIGHIAMALERRGDPTEHGQLWREVVARNLDRFGGWIAAQRARLDGPWQKSEVRRCNRRSATGKSVYIRSHYKN